MYEIKPKILSTDEILNQVSQESIWEYYLGFPIKVGKLFISPVRDEKTASANLFYARDGTLLFKDFGLGTMNIWQYVQYKYNITFQEALQRVSIDLNLRSGIKLDILEKFKPSQKVRDFTNIAITIKGWDRESLEYWYDYSITLTTLKRYRVIPISDMWINNNYIHIKKPAFSYEFGKTIRKIYSPLSETNKFYSNVPGDIYSGFDQLDWVGDILIITKSHKDVMVYRELGYNAIAPQGEGHKMDLEFIEKLKKRFGYIILNFDNDKPGKAYTEKAHLDLKLPYFFIPTEDNIKDISDYIKKYKRDQTKKLLLNDLQFN